MTPVNGLSVGAPIVPNTAPDRWAVLFSRLIKPHEILANGATRHSLTCRLVFTPINAVTAERVIAPVLPFSNQRGILLVF
jgi:hypothetical protein